MSLAIIVHGGAKTIPPEQREAHRRGCLAAVRAGWAILQEGGSSLDAVEAAIRVLEDDPTFNAGLGSELNADGQVQMDAGLMEGAQLQAGAVGGIMGVRNPVSVARRLIDEKPILVVGEAARRYAGERGLELCDPEALITEEKRQSWKEQQEGPEPPAPRNDTVGCVALDSRGNLAAGASTGGLGNHLPGRVGDSALVGCGFYADNQAGGCSMTGEGEEIARVGLARTMVDLMRQSCPAEAAAREGLKILEQRVQGEAGAILIEPEGRIGWAHNSENMAVAYFSSEMDAPAAFTGKQEESEKARVRLAA